MNLDDERDVRLSGRDLMLCRAGLSAYLKAFDEHRRVDGGTSHPDEQGLAVRRQIGQLIWRLEEAGVEPGTRLIHSNDAVQPDP